MDSKIIELLTRIPKLHGKEDMLSVDQKSQQIYVSSSRCSILITGLVWIQNIILLSTIYLIFCKCCDIIEIVWIRISKYHQLSKVTIPKIHLNHFQIQMSCGWRPIWTKMVIFTLLEMMLSTLVNSLTLVPLNEPVKLILTLYLGH